ncbi:MAG: A24 family peptidase [Sneathiellaceae bacterium]
MPPRSGVTVVQAGAALGAAAAIAGWAAAVDPAPLRLAGNCLLGWCLLALAWIDWRTLRLPNVLTLPLLAAGLAFAWADASADFPAHVVGAGAGYAVLALIGLVYRLMRGQEGLGLGDAKLLAAGGAWLGWAALPVTVLLATTLALGLVLAQRLAGQATTRDTALPFGPMLALAIWLMRLYGPALTGY